MRKNKYPNHLNSKKNEETYSLIVCCPFVGGRRIASCPGRGIFSPFSGRCPLQTVGRFCIGQLIVATFPAKVDKQKKKQIRDLVKKYKIGGLLFAEGTPEEQAILTNIAQKNSKVPVMITFDGEWGLSMRLEGTPYFPKNAALGCIEDNHLIYEYGREVAREFRELGVHVNFAPDADVNTNPLNPVIHVRSFGEDPKKVAEKVVAYSRGLA